ncbi:SMP-30/gluconolactonase/LRE family protein [Nocardioides limicola]|uniref:SMP-30/gluconolactonase/LRE family protein n=1 Tax=Nocardioides limicola TaxID=2803368 RepID=UPI00193B8B97|nr:SMP-30/gluconolactonase/LRE family protein [Nocardioides sp. DJM-14]
MSFTVHQVPAHGAEDVVVGLTGADEGAVFTGTADGAIFRLSHDGRKIDRIAHTGGRPLGIEVDGDGRLLVCDAHRGLLRVDVGTGGIEPVLAAVDGVPMKFCNNAAISSRGQIWFTDSSLQYGIERWKDDLVQNTRTGRLLCLGGDGEPQVVLTGLGFANGVALAADESFVAVAETAARTVVRHWLSGERSGTTDLLVEDLPGYPDNIARGSDGLIWVTLASPTDPIVERVQQGPMWLRKQVTKVPERLQPKPKRTIRVQAYDDAGVKVRDLDLDHPHFHMVTGVREHDGRVWMGSLHEPAVAVFDGE